MQQKIIIESAWMKLERAAKLMAEFSDALDAFLLDRAYSFGFAGGARAQLEGLSLYLIRDPRKILLIAGDAFHCLRSSLDHCAVACVVDPKISSDSKIMKQVTFVADEKKSPNKCGQNMTKSGVHPLLADVLINVAKKNGDHWKRLCALTAIDNTDKHRSILYSFSDCVIYDLMRCKWIFDKNGKVVEDFSESEPVTTTLSYFPLVRGNDSLSPPLLSQKPDIFASSATLSCVRAGSLEPRLRATEKTRIEAKLCFENPNPLVGREVKQELLELYKIVELILNNVEDRLVSIPLQYSHSRYYRKILGI